MQKSKYIGISIKSFFTEWIFLEKTFMGEHKPAVTEKHESLYGIESLFRAF